MGVTYFKFLQYIKLVKSQDITLTFLKNRLGIPNTQKIIRSEISNKSINLKCTEALVLINDFKVLLSTPSLGKLFQCLIILGKIVKITIFGSLLVLDFEAMTWTGNNSTIIDHFTTVCSVTWPLNGSEAGGDLVLIQTSLLLLCKSSCSNAD